MPALGNRTHEICEAIVNGLDVMANTVDSFKEFATYAVVHGLCIKGVKLMIKLMFVHWVAFGILILYKIYKTFDAIFIHRREKRYYIPDPKAHCNYMNQSYVDVFMNWLKASQQIEKATSPQAN